MKNVKVTINGIETTVPESYTILDAADKAGIYIPRLCFLKGIHEESSCRICVVDIEGQRGLKNSCTVKVADGMVVHTDNDEIRTSIKKNLELLAHNHTFECWTCEREGNCEFYDLLQKYQVNNVYGEYPDCDRKERLINDSSPAIVIDSGKCVLCGRCISACEKQSGTHVLDFNNRGNFTYVGPAAFQPMEDSGCIYCGKCIQACPVAAIKEKDDTDYVLAALKNPNKHVVISAAPSIRVTLGEEFGLPIGTNVEGKMFAAMEALGFDDIMDTNFTADLTILEEGTEFINRVKNNGVLPLFTSCSPGWIRYIEQYEPEYIPNLSSAKSPQQMGGAITKNYYSEKINMDKEDIVYVSVMPCIAKKYEAKRDEMETDGIRDVDIVLTTREFGRLIKRQEIDFLNLEDIKPNGQLAQYTGAGTIFGATGGVMEAALRTVTEILEETQTPIDFKEVRGVSDIKEATYNVAGIDVNVAVVHGGAHIKDFLKHLRESGKQYHFVEFMGCTGGCINGGGQPIVPAHIQDKVDVRKLRADALYDIDEHAELRKSHLNESVMKLYEEFLGEPNSERAHKLLHTHYDEKSFYTK